MKLRQIVFAATALGLAAFTGCVSVEATKAQLASGDAQLVKQAEETIVHQALYNHQISEEERIQYVKLTKNPKVLFDICTHSRDNRIREAAIKQIDFSRKGVFTRFVKEFGDKFYEFKFERKSASSDLKDMTADLGGESNSAFITWVLDAANHDDLIAVARVLAEGKISCGVLENPLARKVAEFTTDEALLEVLLRHLFTERDRHIAIAKINNPKRLVSLCGDFFFEDALLKKLTEDMVCNFIKNDAGLARISESAEEKMLARVKDNKKLAKALIDRENPDGAKSVVEALAQRSQTCLAGVSARAKAVKIREWAFNLIKDKMVVKQMLASNRIEDALKVKLMDKLDYGDADEKMYATAESKALKKAILRKVSPEVRAAIRKPDRATCEKLIEDAKAKTAKTFQLGGFYLGMPIDDAERLIGYYFPDYETLAENGRLLIPGQNEPFALANKSGSVYQFDFGKKILRTFCTYDVQTAYDWASAYEAANGISMSSEIEMKQRDIRLSSFESLAIGMFGSNEDKFLASPDDKYSMSEYPAFLVQKLYRYKANGKGYRIEYFGERKFNKDNDGGSFNKAMYSKIAGAFSDVSAEEGTLRAKISDD